MNGRIAIAVFWIATCEVASAETCSGVFALEDMGWYKEHMEAAGATPLCATGSKVVERYRLIWLRSFHNPILVNLIRNGDQISLSAVRLSGTGGYKPGRVVERKKASLSRTEFD